LVECAKEKEPNHVEKWIRRYKKEGSTYKATINSIVETKVQDRLLSIWLYRESDR
jgi:hypothetical protein